MSSPKRGQRVRREEELEDNQAAAGKFVFFNLLLLFKLFPRAPLARPSLSVSPLSANEDHQLRLVVGTFFLAGAPPSPNLFLRGFSFSREGGTF